jgi:hypothetical protein
MGRTAWRRAALATVLTLAGGTITTGTNPSVARQAHITDAEFEARRQKLGEVARAVEDAVQRSKLGEPAPGDDAHRALLRRGLQVAGRDALSRVMEWQAGRGDTAVLVDRLQRLSDAEQALHDRPADRLAALERYLALAGALEGFCEGWYERGRMPVQSLLHVRQFRATCQLAVLDAKRGPAAPGPKRNFPPAPPPAPADEKDDLDKIISIIGDETLTAPEPGDDERRKLLKEWHLVSLTEARLRFREYQSGRGTLDYFLACMRRVVASGLALDARPEHQLAAAEQELMVTRAVYSLQRARFDVGRIPVQDFESSVYDRLGAEIRLLELRQQFPGVAAARPPAAANELPKDLPVPPKLTAAEGAEIDRVLQGDVRPMVPVEPAAGDDQRRKLLKARHGWAAQELDARMKEFQAGRGILEDNYDAIERYRTSALALCERPSDRLAVEERVFPLIRAIDGLMRARFQVGRLSDADCWQARANRLEAEVRLLDAKTGAAAPQARP